MALGGKIGKNVEAVGELLGTGVAAGWLDAALGGGAGNVAEVTVTIPPFVALPAGTVAPDAPPDMDCIAATVGNEVGGVDVAFVACEVV